MLTTISLELKQRCCVMNILPFNCKSTLFLSCFVILKLGPANMSPLMAGQCRLCQERAAEIQQRKEPLLVPTCFLPSHAFGGICESCLCVCVCCSVVSDYLWPHGLQPAKLLCPCVFQARILEWVAISFSRGSSQPEDWSQFCTAGRFFTEPPNLTHVSLSCTYSVGFLDPTANSFLWTSSGLQVSWLISPPVGEPLTPGRTESLPWGWGWWKTLSSS